MTPLGRRLLRQAVANIVKYPQTLNMHTWIRHEKGPRGGKKLPRPFCGTTACLAGHVVLAAGVIPEKAVDVRLYRDPEVDSYEFRHLPLAVQRAVTRDWGHKPERDSEISVPNIATALLGRTVRRGHEPGWDNTLFLVDHWPSKFREAYHAAEADSDVKSMAEALRERVEHFIKTGK